MSTNPAADPRELQRFIDRGGQVRLVNNLRTGKLEGVAFRQPGAWGWQELPVRGPAEGVFRQTAVSLVAQMVKQSLPGIAPPTSMDAALSIASMAAGTISAQAVAGKLANIAGQALAWHVGCGTVAPVVGTLLENAVASMPFPASPLAEAFNAATVGVVAFDVSGGRLTPTVTGFTVDMAVQRIDGPAISPGQLRQIAATQQPSRGHLPQPGEKLPRVPAPTSRQETLAPGGLPQPDREELKSPPSPAGQPDHYKPPAPAPSPRPGRL
jgi:hypothetical protein